MLGLIWWYQPKPNSDYYHYVSSWYVPLVRSKMRRLKGTKKAKKLRASWMERRDLQKWSRRMENSWPTNLNTLRILSGKKLWLVNSDCVHMWKNNSNNQSPYPVLPDRNVLTGNLLLLWGHWPLSYRYSAGLAISHWRETSRHCSDKVWSAFPIIWQGRSCLAAMFLFTDLICSCKISLLENIMTGVVIDSFSVWSTQLHKRAFSVPF